MFSQIISHKSFAMQPSIRLALFDPAVPTLLPAPKIAALIPAVCPIPAIEPAAPQQFEYANKRLFSLPNDQRAQALLEVERFMDNLTNYLASDVNDTGTWMEATNTIFKRVKAIKEGHYQSRYTKNAETVASAPTVAPTTTVDRNRFAGIEVDDSQRIPPSATTVGTVVQAPRPAAMPIPPRQFSPIRDSQHIAEQRRARLQVEAELFEKGEAQKLKRLLKEYLDLDTEPVSNVYRSGEWTFRLSSGSLYAGEQGIVIECRIPSKRTTHGTPLRSAPLRDADSARRAYADLQNRRDLYIDEIEKLPARKRPASIKPNPYAQQGASR